MAQYTLDVNGEQRVVEATPDTPLLWVLREDLGLTGTKFGCGLGQCGACTVHLDGEAVRACTIPIADAAGRRVLTIEGLGRPGGHPLQRAWDAEQVTQCGYCQPGQLMQAAALMAKHPAPTDTQIDEAMQGSLCRCGTYPRIRRAIHAAAKEGVR